MVVEATMDDRMEAMDEPLFDVVYNYNLLFELYNARKDSPEFRGTTQTELCVLVLELNKKLAEVNLSTQEAYITQEVSPTFRNTIIDLMVACMYVLESCKEVEDVSDK
jgi:hypothetical protein